MFSGPSEQVLLEKGQTVNMFGLVGLVVSVAINKLCHCRVEAARDNTQRNGRGCVPIKLYL